MQYVTPYVQTLSPEATVDLQVRAIIYVSWWSERSPAVRAMLPESIEGRNPRLDFQVRANNASSISTLASSHYFFLLKNRIDHL